MTQYALDRDSAARILQSSGQTPAEMKSELDRIVARIESSVQQRQAQWLTPPGEGRWSPAQVTEHVIIVNEGMARLMALLLSDRPLRSEPVRAVESVEGKLKAPDALQPGQGSDWATLQPRWQASHASLSALAERLGGADLSRTMPHPVFGELDVHDWFRAAVFHTRHHRRQLEE